MKPSLRRSKVGQGKRSYDRAFDSTLDQHTRLVPDISNNWPSSLSTSSSPSADQYTFSPSSPTADSENSQPDLWDITLDRDLYETIIKLYPEWFKENMAEEISTREEDILNSPGSPRSVVDEASIQKSMERNKESLKVKLLLRRPISQLVEQGILPPLKASPVFYEQSKKLERARMGDILKHKIQRRPDRQALIEQHILEDTTISPGLQDKQRQLKKARLADDLNDRLSHRPGPLELIKGNILVADERVAQAIKEGAIHFKATCEGEPVKHPPPLFHLEDPETSSDGTRSPQDPSPIFGPSFPSLIPNSGVDAVATGSIPPTTLSISQQPPPVPPIASTPPTSSTLSSSQIPIAPLQFNSILPSTSSIATVPQSNVITFTTFNTTPTSATTLPATQIQNCISQYKPIFTTGTTSSTSSSTSNKIFTTGTTSSTSSSTSNKSDSKQRKKSKSKIQPKTRTIKFHEYKGPPNAQKSCESSSASQIETSYELMLKQQQLLLQLELEWQQKMASGIILTSSPPNQEPTENKIHSQTIVIPNPTQPSVQVTSSNVPNTVVTLETPLQKTIASVPPSVSIVPSVQSGSSSSSKVVSKLEDLRVNDLKIELKKRNLTVSGSKPQLIERLKPFAEEVIASVREVVPSVREVVPSVREVVPSVRGKDEPSSPTSSNNSSASPMNDQQKMSVPVSPDSVPMEVEDKSRKPDPMDVNENYTEIQNQHHPSFVSTTFGMNDQLPAITATPFNNGFIINEDILKLQQKRIEQLQRELENSQQQQQQFHFQLQHPFSFHPQAQTISIPLASISATPQFQVISTGPAVNPNNLVTIRTDAAPSKPVPSKTVPSKPVPSSKPIPVSKKCPETQTTSQSKNQRRHSHANGASSTSVNRDSTQGFRKTSAAVKASLAAFLHSQQAAAAQQANSSAASRSEPQTPEPGTSLTGFGPGNTRQTRANSLSSHLPPTASNTLDSSSSLDSSSTLNGSSSLSASNSLAASSAFSVPHISFIEQHQSISGYQRPPPPNYEEATREQTVKVSKEVTLRKKSVKSQAVDDVLEILIKNGELPESAAQEPPTPVEKCNKSGMFASLSKDCFITTQEKNEERNGERNGNEIPVTVKASSGDMNLDLDFALDLQELADSMDLSVDMTHTPDKNSSSSFWIPDLGFSPNEPNGAKKNTMSSSACNNQVSLNELMEAANSVDWLSDLMSNNNNNNNHITGVNNIQQLNNCRNDHRSREVPSDTFTPRMVYDHKVNQMIPNGFNFSHHHHHHHHHGKSMINDNLSLNSSGSSSCSSSYAAKDHDPLLPNNMLGTTSTADPLIDFFFDETDFKSSHDLNVWDRLDFSA